MTDWEDQDLSWLAWLGRTRTDLTVGSLGGWFVPDFMLSEEDKSNPVSVRYWFELVDTNEDGVIRADEMRTFYRHQIHRMECLGHEVVPFEDVLCQMSDLLHPGTEGAFFPRDFVRPDKIRVSGVFFNVLFNLSKFIEFEQRDPFLLRQQLAEPELTYVCRVVSCRLWRVCGF